MTTLRRCVAPVHETAEEWYVSYGAHVSTAECGDLMIQVVDYDDLDHDDATCVEQLLDTTSGLLRDEAEQIVARAREVRDDADAIEGLLRAAVVAWEANDLDATLAALTAADSHESEHGDNPATRYLRAQILDDGDDGDE